MKKALKFSSPFVAAPSVRALIFPIVLPLTENVKVGPVPLRIVPEPARFTLNVPKAFAAGFRPA